MDHEPRARKGKVQSVQGGDEPDQPRPDTELDRPGEAGSEQADYDEGVGQEPVSARRQEAWREAVG